MAYTKTAWKNRLVEKPKTYQLQQNADGTVTLIPKEGTVTEAGTPVNATNMNNIEQGIATVEAALDSHMADDVKHITAVERTTWNEKANVDINHIQPADTVLSWANRQTVNSSILNIDTVVPSDAPYSAEWQFEVLVGDANRKIVRATLYNGGEIYYRTIFNGVWNTNWCKAITDTGGTMAGILTAQANTSYTVAQVRNIIAWDGTGTKPSPVNGAILLTYTP